jgi:hypothetical protein
VQAQFANLDRASATAQTFVAVLTLSASLASPLLVSGLTASLPTYVFSAVLILYLAALGKALRHAIRVIFLRPDNMPIEQSAFGWADIRAFETGQEYAAHVTQLSEVERLQHVLEVAWRSGYVVTEKFREMEQSRRWTAISLILLALLVVCRLAISIYFPDAVAAT